MKVNCSIDVIEITKDDGKPSKFMVQVQYFPFDDYETAVNSAKNLVPQAQLPEHLE